MSKVCVGELCMSKLCVGELCVSKLCVSKLCVSCCMCVGGQKEAGGGGTDGGAQPKTRTPHKDVGKKCT